MGSLALSSRMKMLIVLALAACVAADADPYYYGGYGLGYGGYGLGYRSYGLGYGGYGLGYRSYGYYGKRDADAEPKADADPTTMEAMDWATEAMVLTMEAMVDTVDTMESVMLMLSLQLLLIPTMAMEAMAMETLDWEASAGDVTVATVATMASVRLMLSLLLMLIPTTMEAMDMAMELVILEAMSWLTLVCGMVMVAK